MINKPKILFYDIENSHTEVLTFNFWQTNIPYTQVRKEWFIFSISYQWEGQKKVKSISLLDDSKRFKKDHTDDYYVVKAFREIIIQADVIIAHNGDSFDIKKFNARLIKHRLKPLPKVIQIDTKKMAKSVFKFNFNSLDSLGTYLDLGNKLHTDLQLWLDCINGVVSAIKKMVKYNKQDVSLLMKVYYRLAPYCKTTLNRNMFTKEEVCDVCGSSNLSLYGWRVNKTRRYRRFKCQDCGATPSSVKSDSEISARLK